MTIVHISHIPVYVRDQNEARDWYCDKLGFRVCDDNSQYVPGYRWLTVSPAKYHATQFILMPATSASDKTRIGKNGMCVLTTDDCRGDCEELEHRGVVIIDAAKTVPWGISAIIEDLYGNPYNLLERPVARTPA